ncbi:uncharacterized protein Fot_12335 [Forsythia ovata]|uniref:GRF-type domain-containing protein n=1 Tax=Forsythia ovata TaxID=205694 RepID=A0ABD1WR40_9LAMI
MENSCNCTPILKRKLCYCGEVPILKTSWTEMNPGRRFWGCRFYGKVGACDFFEWGDPAPHARYKSVMNGLLRKKSEAEEEIVKMGRTMRNWKIALWVVLMFIFVRCVNKFRGIADELELS